MRLYVKVPSVSVAEGVPPVLGENPVISIPLHSQFPRESNLANLGGVSLPERRLGACTSTPAKPLWRHASRHVVVVVVAGISDCKKKDALP